MAVGRPTLKAATGQGTEPVLPPQSLRGGVEVGDPVDDVVDVQTLTHG